MGLLCALCSSLLRELAVEQVTEDVLRLRKALL